MAQKERGSMELEILPAPSLLPPALAHPHIADLRIFFSELLNGRSIPQLTRSFSLLSYLVGNTVYLDVPHKSQLPPGASALFGLHI